MKKCITKLWVLSSFSVRPPNYILSVISLPHTQFSLHSIATLLWNAMTDTRARTDTKNRPNVDFYSRHAVEGGQKSSSAPRQRPTFCKTMDGIFSTLLLSLCCGGKSVYSHTIPHNNGFSFLWLIQPRQHSVQWQWRGGIKSDCLLRCTYIVYVMYCVLVDWYSNEEFKMSPKISKIEYRMNN